MLLASSCLFTMYVYRVTLVMPDLQCMFMVPLTLECLEERSSHNERGTRRRTTPESWFSDSFEDESSPRKS